MAKANLDKDKAYNKKIAEEILEKRKTHTYRALAGHYCQTRPGVVMRICGITSKWKVLNLGEDQMVGVSLEQWAQRTLGLNWGDPVDE